MLRQRADELHVFLAVSLTTACLSHFLKESAGRRTRYTGRERANRREEAWYGKRDSSQVRSDR
jgi:hypothetical protein